MVVHHIQDDAHPPGMDGIHQLLKLHNAHSRVIRVGGVHACEREIGLRVIAPVVVLVFRGVIHHPRAVMLVDVVVVHDRQQLDVRHAQVL